MSTKSQQTSGRPKRGGTPRLQVARAPSPTENLLAKLEQWLLVQPEWPAIQLAPRNLRRQFARAVAKRVTTIPTRLTIDGSLRAFVPPATQAEVSNDASKDYRTTDDGVPDAPATEAVPELPTVSGAGLETVGEEPAA